MFHLSRCRGALVALAALVTFVSSLPSASSSSAFPATHRPSSVDEHSQRDRFGRRAVPIPDPASRVNLFIGTTNTGHAFPGE